MSGNNALSELQQIEAGVSLVAAVDMLWEIDGMLQGVAGVIHRTISTLPKAGTQGELIRQLRECSYPQYLQHEIWKRRRLMAIHRAGSRCQVCNGPGPLEVHHRTYANRGCEAPMDLTVLCVPCHDLFEQERGITRG